MDGGRVGVKFGFAGRKNEAGGRMPPGWVCDAGDLENGEVGEALRALTGADPVEL